MSSTLVIFDFDKTLITGDSFRCFGRHVATSVAEVHWQYWLALLAKLGMISTENYKARIVERFTEHSPEAQVEIIASLLEDLESMTDDRVRDAMNGHLSAGHQVTVMTASPAFYVKPFVESWGGSVDVFGSNPGEAGQSHLQGESKAVVARELVHRGKRRAVWVYTDHHSDLPLIRLADHVRLVRPTRRLRKELNRLNIPFEVFG